MSNFVTSLYESSFIANLRNQLEIHHGIYRLSCSSEYLEEMIAHSLEISGYKNDWEPNRSHAISVDMTLQSGKTLSIKSGTYDKKNSLLTISGSRLGKHSNISNMVKAIKSDAADIYFSIARLTEEWKPVPLPSEPKTYYFFAFESHLLGYDKHPWIKKETSTGRSNYYMEGPGIKAEIRESMSHQLWTTISTSLIGEPVKLVVS